MTWKPCVLAAVAVVALVAVAGAEDQEALARELGSQSFRLLAGPEPGDTTAVRPQSERTQAISNRIIRFVESYRESITHGNSVHPPLDPYRNDALGPYVLGTDAGLLFKLTTQFNELEVIGLNSFVIESLVFSLLRFNLNFQVTIPDITTRSNYDAQAVLALFFNHRAIGNVRITAKDINVDGFIQMTIVNGYLQASSLQLDLTVARTYVYLTELTGVGLIDLILNLVLQSVSSDVVQENIGQASESISNHVLDLINQVLGEYKLEDLFD